MPTYMSVHEGIRSASSSRAFTGYHLCFSQIFLSEKFKPREDRRRQFVGYCR